MRVLVIDDNPEVRQLLHTALSVKGYAVKTLSDATGCSPSLTKLHAPAPWDAPARMF